jgi:transposase InsO family protein
MNIHKNARLTPHGREHIIRMVRSGLTPKAAATAAGVSPRTVWNWLRRYRLEGSDGLRDRSSRPHRLRKPTPQSVVDRIEVLRRQRMPGKQIAQEAGVSPSTVSRVLRRLGLSKFKALEPVDPVRRYERERPGELLHIDIKMLGRFVRTGHRITGDRQKGESRGAGHEFVHVAIDDASRLAFCQIRPDQKKESAVAFLEAAVADYRRLGINVTGVMTDNGSCYRAKAFVKLCKRLNLKHIFTKPYRPQTNGKAERFIQTALREWAYAKAYDTSDQRADDLPLWLHRYNWHRPHASLDAKPPISRLGLPLKNLLRFHS